MTTSTDLSLQGNSYTLNLIVRPQERTTLGIGAGGNIAQEIHADKSNPRLWDVASSKILYIHIVNSQDFRTITGLAPPESPINWKTYADLRLPFDRDWGRSGIEGKGVSSDGAFDDLVSLEESEEPITDYGDWRDEDGRDESWAISQKVPGFPLVMLEADQTVPWFEAQRLDIEKARARRVFLSRPALPRGIFVKERRVARGKENLL